ncbi:C4-type zinc ribbon domain-containing protein [Deltaproteobacteria bacterium TL4]
MPQFTAFLVELAKVDHDRITIRRRSKDLEQEIKFSRKEVDQLEHKLEAIHQENKESTKLLHHAKLELEACDQLISKMEAQVPLIRNQKEFAASKKQLEDARKRRGQTEDEVLTHEIKKEDTGQNFITLQDSLQSKNELYEALVKDLIKERDANEKQLEKIERRRKVILKQLDKPILKFYEQSIERGVINPICQVEDNACGGCHIELLPQLVNELKMQVHSYRNCPHCSRILFIVPPDLAQTTDAKN